MKTTARWQHGACRHLGLVLAAAAVLTAAPSSAEELAWKFKKGDKAQYASLNKMEMSIDASGVQFDIELDQALDTTWEVLSVADDGTAELSQTIDRMQFKLNSPFTGEFVYDSKNPTEGEGPIWERIGPVLEGMTGEKITLKITPKGEVKDIVLPKLLTDALEETKGGDGASAMFGAGFSEDTIKQMIAGGVLSLPGGNVNADQSWDVSEEMKMGPLGTQKTKTTYKLAGMEDRDGTKVAKIEVAAEVTIEAGENEDVEMELTEQESSGTIYFDPATGRTLDATTKQMITLEGDFQGNEFIQERTMTVSIKQGTNADILPPPAKDEAPAESADDNADDDDAPQKDEPKKDEAR